MSPWSPYHGVVPQSPNQPMVSQISRRSPKYRPSPAPTPTSPVQNAPESPRFGPTHPSRWADDMAACLSRMRQAREEVVTQYQPSAAAPVRPVYSPASLLDSPALPLPTTPARQAALLAPPSLVPPPPGVVSLTGTAASSGRRIVIPRRIVERDRRYRNLKNELGGTEFQAQSMEFQAKVH
jgi:hypothetical protein